MPEASVKQVIWLDILDEKTSFIPKIYAFFTQESIVPLFIMQSGTGRWSGLLNIEEGAKTIEWLKVQKVLIR